MTEQRYHQIRNGIWLIGLGVLFYTGKFWPGILILIGISMIIDHYFKPDERKSEVAEMEPGYRGVPVEPQSPAVPEPAETATVPPPAPTPLEDQPVRRVDLLPDICDMCGAAVRPFEVRWNSADTANCAYCSAALKMKI